MNIQTVASNLRNTIASKEKMLAGIKNPDDIFNWEARAAAIATREFLEINIDELKRILKDVEVCAKKESDDSWITNPDRMGGGGWTADELDPNRGWK
jgi:hypothetical protein